jgi:hypothetical protein
MIFEEISSNNENIIYQFKIKYLNYKNANAMEIIQSALDRFIHVNINVGKNKDKIIDFLFKTEIKNGIKCEIFIFKFLYDIYEFKVYINEIIQLDEVNYEIFISIENLNKIFRDNNNNYYNKLIDLAKLIKYKINAKI